MDKKQEYYIGLDGGTDSVGWAVVNPDYTVAKKRGKALWGARLFESGQTAADRRVARSGRRRTDRKKWRLKLLKEIFNEEVARQDPAFFMRLAESFYWEEDKKVDGADSLFHDADFTDRDYHNQFPTVYHLRQYLMHCEEKPDIRLFYLAVAHIIKNRGHFLNEGKNLDEVRLFGDVWQNFCAMVSDVLNVGTSTGKGICRCRFAGKFFQNQGKIQAVGKHFWQRRGCQRAARAQGIGRASGWGQSSGRGFVWR